MTKILKLLVLMMVVSLLSCKTTKITDVQKTNDSIIIVKKQRIYVPVKSAATIQAYCDSLGQIRAFEFVLVAGGTNVLIEAKNGQITAVAESKSDTISSTDIKKSHIEYRDRVVKTSKNVIPKWMWWICGVFVVYIVYRIARIFVPFLKILPY